jgi:hypothetical protein
VQRASIGFTPHGIVLTDLADTGLRRYPVTAAKEAVKELPAHPAASSCLRGEVGIRRSAHGFRVIGNGESPKPCTSRRPLTPGLSP